jgi:hypothetical protein
MMFSAKDRTRQVTSQQKPRNLFEALALPNDFRIAQTQDEYVVAVRKWAALRPHLVEYEKENECDKPGDPTPLEWVIDRANDQVSSLKSLLALAKVLLAIAGQEKEEFVDALKEVVEEVPKYGYEKFKDKVNDKSRLHLQRALTKLEAALIKYLRSLKKRSPKYYREVLGKAAGTLRGIGGLSVKVVELLLEPSKIAGELCGVLQVIDQEERSASFRIFDGSLGGDALPSTFYRQMVPNVLPELELGRIDDPTERDAEATADRVMLMRVGGACCSACASGGPCVSHAEEIERGQARPIRRQASGNGGGLPVPADLEPQVRRATSGGEALPRAVRAFFEPRFGQALSHVRIHRTADAGASAKALGARAYTLGEHIAFGSGRWAPGTDAGDRLIAHELTHVLQQGSLAKAAASPIRRDASSEQDVKRVISREALAQQQHLKSAEAQLNGFLAKRKSGIESLLTELGPAPKAARAKDRAKRLQEDLGKDLATILKKPDSGPVLPDLRADIVKSARSLDAARNKLDRLNKKWSKYDATFAGEDVAKKLGSSLTPAQLKALIGQESYDLTRNEVKGDIVGVAQMGSAQAKEAGGAPADRKVPEKAIPLAARFLAILAGKLDKSLKAKVTGVERSRFIMAAYNGGPNLIVTAQKFAIEMKRDGTTWQSLIEGKRNSPLYKALKVHYKAGREDDKYREVNKYVHNIEARLSSNPQFLP